MDAPEVEKGPSSSLIFNLPTFCPGRKPKSEKIDLIPNHKVGWRRI
jgi:hypothetical protein